MLNAFLGKCILAKFISYRATSIRHTRNLTQSSEKTGARLPALIISEGLAG